MPQGRIKLGSYALASSILACAGVLGATSASYAAWAPASAFVSIDGNEPLGQEVQLGDQAGFNSNDASNPASVVHLSTGEYEVIFPGLGSLNGGLTTNWEQAGAQVRAADGHGNCRAEPTRYTYELDSRVPKGSLGIRVACFSPLGYFADTRFVVTDSYGPIGSSGSVNAIIPGQLAEPIGSLQTVDDIEGGVGGNGTYTYVRAGIGRYTATLPYVGGSGPLNLAVSAQDSGGIGSNVACSADSNDAPYAQDGRTVVDVKVACQVPSSGIPRDTEVSISYTRGTTLIGASNNNLAAAAFKVPKTTSNISVGLSSPDQVFNQVYGVPGGASITRTDTGTYKVDLDHQAWAIGSRTILATATQPGASCVATNPTYLADYSTSEFTVRCSSGDEDQGPQATDSGFYISYMSRQ